MGREKHNVGITNFNFISKFQVKISRQNFKAKFQVKISSMFLVNESNKGLKLYL